jgi:prepilin-type N-terminal cleavage/methylation domain-containing protein
MYQRKGFTLVELLTTMTMGSSIMLLAIGLVHQSMTMSKLAKVRWEHDQSLARLAQQFRSDVHAAAEVTSISAESLSLKLPDNSAITYKFEADTLRWQKTSPSTDVAHDTFRFSPGCTGVFSLQEDSKFIVLHLERRLDSSEFLPPVDLRVVAAIGRWTQLEQAGGALP